MKSSALFNSLLTVLVTLSTNALCQLSKGTVAVGGEISYFKHSDFSDNIDEEYQITQTDIRILPSVGLFVSDATSVGVIAGINFQKRISSYDETLGDTKLKVIGLFGRHYWPLTDSHDFAVFADLSMLYSRGDSRRARRTDFELREARIAVAPGFSYFFNERWSAEILLQGISYTDIKHIDEIEGDINGSELVFGVRSMQPRIGIRFFISRTTTPED